MMKRMFFLILSFSGRLQELFLRLPNHSNQIGANTLPQWIMGRYQSEGIRNPLNTDFHILWTVESTTIPDICNH